MYVRISYEFFYNPDGSPWFFTTSHTVISKELEILHQHISNPNEDEYYFAQTLKEANESKGCTINRMDLYHEPNPCYCVTYEKTLEG